MTSDAYTTAYNEVKSLGGDGITTPTQRTPEQTFIGIFWGYDGTPSLCAPPRLYNQISGANRRPNQTPADSVSPASGVGECRDGRSRHDRLGIEIPLRFLATRLLESASPIRAPARPARAMATRPLWATQLHAARRAGQQLARSPNFTPPFPAYPSGHATFGGAIFQILRRFYGTDNIGFTFVSDEFNGVTRDNGGNVRPLHAAQFLRSFTGGGRERPEPDLSRNSLVIRQDRGHRAGSTRRGLRVRSRLHAVASLIVLVRRTIVVA